MDSSMIRSEPSAELVQKSRYEISCLPNVGRATVAEIENALARVGRRFLS